MRQAMRVDGWTVVDSWFLWDVDVIRGQESHRVRHTSPLADLDSSVDEEPVSEGKLNAGPASFHAVYLCESAAK